MRYPSRVVEKLADRNIRKWTQAQHAQDRLAKRDPQENVGPYLTVSREAGAGGSVIASRVAQKLGWDVLDKQIVDELSDEYGTPRSLLEHVDEQHLSWLEDFISAATFAHGFSESAYVHRLHQLLMVAAHHGNVVIVGRGSRFILPRERGFSVRILAPLEFRIEQTLLQHGLTADAARQQVESLDRQRESFVKEHFQQNAEDPHQYDLVVNVEKVSQREAVNLIVGAATCWMNDSGITVEVRS